MDDRKITLADSLDTIFQTVNTQGFSTQTLELVRESLDYVAGFFKLDDISIVMMAAILEHVGRIDEKELAKLLGCTNIEFIKRKSLLRAMEKAGIITGGHGRRGSYDVTPEAFKAIENNKEFVPEKNVGLSTDEMFGRFKRLYNSFFEGMIYEEDLLDEVNRIMDLNDELPFCKSVKASDFGDCCESEKRIFFFMCTNYLTEGSDALALDRTGKFCDYFDDESSLKRHFLTGTSALQKADLVSNDIQNGFMSNKFIVLSDNVKNTFFPDIVMPKEQEMVVEGLVKTGSIKPKQLFFNSEENEKIDNLASLMDDLNFKEVQKRLEDSGMRKGFNVIFYGGPGTGKTASVYELARRSGRDIFVVDMSKMKSKWVGDSEKSVKALFATYKHLCKKSGKAPILLFNEADAIFGKRFENVDDSVDQMLNAIQNIILQEMEDIEGILIATTNLVGNLDDAFERRFIYKIEFRLPDKEAREKIWKSMISSLSDEDAATLSERYGFSGGNIENIARKSVVEYILSGKKPDLETIDKMCKGELLKQKPQRNKIGF